jgi:hypothetical protein
VNALHCLVEETCPYLVKAFNYMFRSKGRTVRALR